MAIEHWVHIGSQIFFGSYLVLIGAGRFVARRWPPPIIPLVTANPQPVDTADASGWIFEDSQRCRYRFRYARTADLKSFVELAMSDPAIVMTYSYLSPDEWVGVYRRWFGILPTSLAVLERQTESTQQWNVAAVSIVAPLSPRGAEQLWTGEIGTVDIGAGQVSRGHKPTVFLLDLLASDRRGQKAAPQMVLALSKAHLAHHRDPWPNHKMEIWIEPVHRALPKLLEAIGFEGPHVTSHHTFYRLLLPLRGIHYSQRQKHTAAELVRGIHECANWPFK
ncbi:MAG TPA: hypothetical protein VGQ65_23960 [Thermoanaerobaculia bacterium]|jgi:hypothetical protein|nr:hypothetical protein [Thermoanaerobaculia bacterium]